ncbi:MAG: undecaprenyl-diphosphatase UppP [Thermodesulfobacteriota bacterium]
MKISVFQAIFLGVVQGITEFLPISSSGHLVFFQSFLGVKEPPIFFDVMLHLGTLFAVVVYFWKDILEIFRGIQAACTGRGKDQQGMRLFFWIIIATIPTGLMGLFFKDWFESFFSQPRLVGGILLITGFFLWLTRWSKKEGRNIMKMRWFDAILIGMAQGIAIIPGISRSGATISTGLLSGLDRDLAAKFSFLLSIPAILGATVLELDKMGGIQELGVTLIGTAIAFAMGILSLTFLIKINKIENISNFSYYCWIIGIAIIILI